MHLGGRQRPAGSRRHDGAHPNNGQGVIHIGGGAFAGVPSGAAGSFRTVAANPSPLASSQPFLGHSMHEIAMAFGIMPGSKISETQSIGGTGATPNASNTPQGGVA